jgi:uncharacterized protein YndB with AHSA1/START domain
MNTKVNKNVRSTVVIERVFNSPIAKVWKALTSKEDMKKWSFDLKEFRPQAGFEFHIDIEHEGIKYFHRCKITEVIPEKKFAYSWRYEGYTGDSLVIFELFDIDGKTKLRLTHEGLETFPNIPAFAAENFMKGWTQIIGEGLKQFLEKEALIISRVFDAPPKSVWEAWSEPQRVMRWWGPKTFTSPSCRIDFRVGGKYLFCMRSDSGPETWKKGIWSTGVYKQITPMEKIVYTDNFADEQGNVVPAAYYEMEGFPPDREVMIRLEPVDGGKTKMTLEHDGIPEKMKERCRAGWSESFDKLAESLIL